MCDWIGKTDQLGTFIVLRNVNLKNSRYNSVIVSGRSMGLALEIKHLFSFKQRGLIIADSFADSLSCLKLDTQRHPQLKPYTKHATTPVTNHNRRQSLCVGDEVGPCCLITCISPTICTGFSVFCMVKKKVCGKADLVTSCYVATVF